MHYAAPVGTLSENPRQLYHVTDAASNAERGFDEVRGMPALAKAYTDRRIATLLVGLVLVGRSDDACQVSFTV